MSGRSVSFCGVKQDFDYLLIREISSNFSIFSFAIIHRAIFTWCDALWRHGCGRSTVYEVEEWLSHGKTTKCDAKSVRNHLHDIYIEFRVNLNAFKTFSYDIMLSCWRLVPESRPNFDKLEEMIGKLLPNGVDRHYVCLNEPYVQANVLNKCRSQTDYFALMTSPSYHAPSVPESPSVLETAESQPTSKSLRETFSAHDKIGARLRSYKQSENEAEEMPMMKRSDQYVPVDFGNSNNCQYVNVLTNPKSNQCNVVASTEHKEVDGNRCASNPCYLMVSQDDAMKI